MNVKQQQFAIFGAGDSGIGTAEFLVRQGARVRLVDRKPLNELKAGFAERLEAAGVKLVAQEEAALDGIDVALLSPGVPPQLALFDEARRRGIAVTGELEFCSRFLKGPILGITGSNGKTTTTALCGHLLKECGIAAQVGGNIGTPLAALLETSRDDQWNVLELSSFMLELADQLHVRIAAILNITPDHLDRHGSMENYVAAKRAILRNQTADDHAVLNACNEAARASAAMTRATVHEFSSRGAVERGFWMEGADLIADGEFWMPVSEVQLQGRHNIENVLAAGCCARLAGALLEDLRAAVASFGGVEHRIEFTRELDGVRYYNDSKGTNVDATIKALESFPSGIWLILGGRDKHSDYTPLAPLINARCRGVLLIGEAASIIEPQLAALLRVPLIQAGTMGAAVAHAARGARRGDVVLLSPACASFDQYSGYPERGRHFKTLVNELEQRP
jgi:UDP-N-acetylmuramoylalanine--D-glutamate ligase